MPNKYDPTHVTYVTIRVTHTGELPDLGQMVAQRVHTMDKVASAEVAHIHKALIDVMPKLSGLPERSFIGANK